MSPPPRVLKRFLFLTFLEAVSDEVYLEMVIWQDVIEF